MSLDWTPLESNPEVLNSYLSDLGVNIKDYCLHEVLSTEDWAI
jgi:hypothetical protein